MSIPLADWEAWTVRNKSPTIYYQDSNEYLKESQKPQCWHCGNKLRNGAPRFYCTDCQAVGHWGHYFEHVKYHSTLAKLAG